MADHRPVPILAFAMTFLLGLGLGASQITRTAPMKPWEIDPDFRRDHVDGFYADYRAGRIIYTAMLPVLRDRLKVRVVHDRWAGAEYGFVPLDELRERPGHFWYIKPHGFEIKKYDDNTLFVILDDRYAQSLEDLPLESGFVPVSADEKAKSRRRERLERDP